MPLLISPICFPIGNGCSLPTRRFCHFNSAMPRQPTSPIDFIKFYSAHKASWVRIKTCRSICLSSPVLAPRRNCAQSMPPMQGLLKKIEDSAAERLTLPPGRQAAQELARFKTFLKVESHRLKILHRAGGGGIEICQARATILDLLLRYLWATVKAALSEQAQKEFPELALVAIG